MATEPMPLAICFVEAQVPGAPPAFGAGIHGNSQCS